MHINCLNEAMNCKKSVMPTPGMLGTMFVGTDRYIVVCAKVLSPKSVFIIQHMSDDFINTLKTVKDGVEYIPEEIAKALYDSRHPNPSNEYYEKIANEYGENEAVNVYKTNLTHFNDENTYSLRRNGRWMQKGRGAWETGSIHWGAGENYRDPSF